MDDVVDCEVSFRWMVMDVRVVFMCWFWGVGFFFAGEEGKRDRGVDGGQTCGPPVCALRVPVYRNPRQKRWGGERYGGY